MRGRNGWRLLTALAALAALVLLGAACSGGSQAADPGSGTTTHTATPTPTPTEPPDADDTSSSGDTQILSGVFESGFEHSAFYPNRECAAHDQERYWVSWVPESRFDQRIDDLTGEYPFAEPGVLAFRVTVRGDLSPEGRYGHLGQYARELVVHEVVAAEVASGCDTEDGSAPDDADSSDADSGGDSDPSSYASPPPVSATVDGSTVPLGLGSYCWTQPSGPGLCADTIGIITGAVPLTVQRGDVIALASDLELSNATVQHSQAFPARTPLASGPDWLAWQPDEAAIPLDLVDGPEGATLTVDLDPAVMSSHCSSQSLRATCPTASFWRLSLRAQRLHRMASRSARRPRSRLAGPSRSAARARP